MILDVTTRTEWTFTCPGCGNTIRHDDLGELAYERHDICVTANMELVKRVKAENLWADVYGWLCDHIDDVPIIDVRYYDREPQPYDGPDYYAEHYAWRYRNIWPKIQ